jgi:hypothetical protein
MRLLRFFLNRPPLADEVLNRMYHVCDNVTWQERGPGVRKKERVAENAAAHAHSRSGGGGGGMTARERDLRHTGICHEWWMVQYMLTGVLESNAAGAHGTGFAVGLLGGSQAELRSCLFADGNMTYEV